MSEEEFDAPQEQKLLLELVKDPENQEKKMKFFNYINSCIKGIFNNKDICLQNEYNILKVIQIINENDIVPLNFKRIFKKIKISGLKIKKMKSEIKKYELKIKKWQSKKSKIKNYPLKIEELEPKIKDSKLKIKNLESKIKERQSKINICKIPIEQIFSSFFKQILNIPIYLPSTFQGFLSGEFIIYLMYNGIEFYRKDRYKCALINDINGQTKNEIDQENYNRFYESQSSYLKQFEKYFYVDLNKIKKSIVNSKKVARKETKSWLFFSAFDYLNFEINKSGKNKGGKDILLDLTKTYIDAFSTADLKKLNLDQANLLILKTLFFQQLSDEEKSAISLYSLLSKCFIQEIKKYMMDMRSLIYLASYKKNNTTEYDNDWIIFFQFLREIEDIMESKIKSLECKENQKLIIEDDNIHFVIVLKMINQENLNYLKAISYLHDLNENESFNELNQINESLNSNGKNIDEPINVFDWENFGEMYRTQIDIINSSNKEDDKRKNINKRNLKEIWLKAIKIIAYCYPEKHNNSIKVQDIPNKDTSRDNYLMWLELENHKDFIQKVRINEIFAAILIITEPKNNIKLDSIDDKRKQLFTIINEIRDDDNNVIRTNIHELMSIMSSRLLMSKFDIKHIKKLQDLCFEAYKNIFTTDLNINKSLNLAEFSIFLKFILETKSFLSQTLGIYKEDDDDNNLIILKNWLKMPCK